MDSLVKIKAENINFFYGKTQALRDINLDVRIKQVTAIIGPSGCGKSTFIRLLNRMDEMVSNTQLVGRLMLDGLDIRF
jgi:phosphate transport system ATP-binding protein